MTTATIYLIRERWQLGNDQTRTGFVERDDTETGLEATVWDLVNGCIECPLEVWALDVSDGTGTVRNVSGEIARAVANRLLHVGLDPDSNLLNFIQTHAGMEVANELERAA